MRFLFSSLPSHGHTYPLIPLALAARSAGHDVLYATGPSFVGEVKAFGIDTVAAGITIFEAFRIASAGPTGRPTSRENAPPEPGFDPRVETFGAVLPRAFLDDLGPIIDREKPDLVVHEVANVGAYFAAKRAGIPRVCHGYGRVVAGDAEASNRRLADFAREVGVPYDSGFARGGGDPYLDIYPSSLQGKEFLQMANRISLRPVPVSARHGLPGWIVGRDRGRPLVFLTLGTGMGPVSVFRQAIDGLVRLGVDVLVATGPIVDVSALGDVPDNVRVEAWVSQADLLPHVDLVVHHGGSGTTLGALAAGLPQLVLPQVADQFINAEAIASAGAGDQLLAGEVSAEAVATMVKRLLAEDAPRARAREVAAEIAGMPSPEEIVLTLVDMAERR